MELRRKRVEQKGRFTITEILSSPYSSHVSSPTRQGDESLIAANDAPTSSGSCIRGATNQSQLRLVESDSLADSASIGPVKLKVNKASEIHMQSAETEAVAMDFTSEVATSAAASALGSPLRKYPLPKKSRDGVQRARRIKRKGRFTIIEMASDSPTSRKNSDESLDHRFITTTSIRGSSSGSYSLDGVEHNTKPKRATRSMSHVRQSSFMRRSRPRSECFFRTFVESDSSENQQEVQEYAELPVLESIDAMARLNLTVGAAAGTGAKAPSNARVPVSMASVTSPDSMGTATILSSSFLSTTPPQLANISETNSSTTDPPQSPVTATQYLQQQRTIASLIRQQHDMKQIIGVLQEQQQQLISIPSQINELKRQTTSFNNGHNNNNVQTRDDEMRELCVKVDSLMRENESLHSLLNTAEQEVRHRTLQIECLSEENDELRQRCGQLELFLHPGEHFFK